MNFKQHYIGGHSGITFPDHDNLSREECYELVKIYQDESVSEAKRIKARNLVTERHQKFIAKGVQSFWESHRDKDRLDLWEAASEGFLIAFDKADIEKLKYIKFSTYAAWWMKAYMTEAAKNDGNMRYSSSYHRKMHAENKKLREECKTLSPIQAHHKWNEFLHQWGAMQSNMGNSMPSLDQHINPGNKSTIADTIASDDDKGIISTAGQNILRKGLYKAINRLNPVEKKVVSTIYGINSQEGNFKQLGEELNMSKNDAKKIRNIALQKIRKDKDFKQVLSSLNIMTSISSGHDVFSLLTQKQ